MWNKNYQKEALKQGWGIFFNIDKGKKEIQRVLMNEDGDIKGCSYYLFDSDWEAFIYVVNGANLANQTIYKLALKEIFGDYCIY